MSTSRRDNEKIEKSNLHSKFDPQERTNVFSAHSHHQTEIDHSFPLLESE